MIYAQFKNNEGIPCRFAEMYVRDQDTDDLATLTAYDEDGDPYALSNPMTLDYHGCAAFTASSTNEIIKLIVTYNGVEYTQEFMTNGIEAVPFYHFKQYFTYERESSVIDRHAQVTVRIPCSGELAVIYDDDDEETANPFDMDQTGTFGVRAASGIYDIYIDNRLIFKQVEFLGYGDEE